MQAYTKVSIFVELIKEHTSEINRQKYIFLLYIKISKRRENNMLHGVDNTYTILLY